MASSLSLDESRNNQGPGYSPIDVAAMGLLITNIEEHPEQEHPASQLLRLIMDNIPQGVFWKNLESVYIWCNRNFAVDAGVSTPVNIVGKTDYDLAWPKEEGDWYREVDRRVMDTNSPEYQIIEPQTRSDGKQAWVVTNKMPLHDTQGRVIGVLGTYEDITKRKQAEEALQRAHDELEIRVRERTAAEREQRTLAEALRDTAALLNSTLHLDEVLDRILSEIGKVVPHNVANIVLIDSGLARVMRFQSHTNLELPIVELGRQFNLDELPGLQLMLDTKQPFIVENTAKTPSWIPHPETSWVRSFLGAPILIEDEVIGFINLNSSIPGFFGPLQAERLRAFANQAAIAIQNARLYERAQELAVVEERQRLARDLHDAVSQTLWTVCLIADILPTLWVEDLEEGQRSLDKLQRLARGALAEMRTLLLELRPAALVKARLGDLMHQLAQAVMSRKKVDILVTVLGDSTIPADIQIGLYRLAQEALNNIVKHARATQVDLKLIYRPDQVMIHICDNGQGFNPQHTPSDGLGLGIMRERSESMGADLEINSQIGVGTEVKIIWPGCERSERMSHK